MTRSPLPEAAAEVAALRRRIAESAPRRGWRPPDDAAVRFATLPLSARTLAGLAAGGFETLKPIQRAAIPHALADRDVLGAARTGSGKTLAFLVPAVEALYRERWAREDGLGALVVSPTRELASRSSTCSAPSACSTTCRRGSSSAARIATKRRSASAG